MSDLNPRDAGHLIRESVLAARELAHVDVTEVVDPRDGTVAPVVISDQGVYAVEPGIFDKYRKAPIARAGTAHLTTLETFIDLTNRFAVDSSVVFAVDDMARAKLTTIFDYHADIDSGGATANLKHKAEYAFPFSDEWKAWHGKNAEIMTMAEFAQFLEDRIVDVDATGEPTSPEAKAFVAAINGKLASPSKLIELARNLQVYENSTLKEARNLSSGEGQLTFTSEHVDADGKPLSIPNLFMILIPVFARSPDYYRLLARLRYRKANGGVVFWYELWRADLAFEQAFAEACAQVRERTTLPLFIGTAEG
ncbi:DUF2303 family protein [uncultured Novosphingobium sp.]|uniref:DUF2303 family protein n=1 Tax=uncultured Novosphingobium sp. TaxID=292277 RepID=UPI003749FD1A